MRGVAGRRYSAQKPNRAMCSSLFHWGLSQPEALWVGEKDGAKKRQKVWEKLPRFPGEIGKKGD
jgi:hypothetical protein